TAVIAGSHRRVGGEPRRGVRSAADRRRRRPQRPRRWFLRGPPLPERRNILHPRPRRCRSAFAAGARTGSDRGGHRVRVPCPRHRLLAGALSVVLAARGGPHPPRFARGPPPPPRGAAP